MVLQKEKKPKKRIGRKTNMIYYISDLHFKDQFIFEVCSRPFIDLKEMEEQIVKRWNDKVKDEDVVYILGDISKEDDSSSLGIFKELKGHKHLIVGNHDHLILEDIKKENIFESIKYIDLIDDNNRLVCICHYPLMDWPEMSRGAYLIYGHIHNKTPKNGHIYKMMKDYYKNLPAYNCSIDVCGFEPRTLDELIHLKEVNKDEPYIN